MAEEEERQSINEENPEDKSVAFFAGRANPPTPGHIKIMIQMLEFARNNDMMSRIYLSSSFNNDKKDITHITNDKSDSNLRSAPYHTHVKHKNYENPLTPQEKKEFVVEMLFNATGISKAELEEIVVVTRQCQPLYFALACVSALQPDKEKQYYFMGKEKDKVEAMRREKDCEYISLDNGTSFVPTDNGTGRYKCILVSREDDPSNPASGMSGSKIRLLVASEEAVSNENTAKEAFQKVYTGLLSPDQSDDMFEKIKQGMLFSSQRPDIEAEGVNVTKRASVMADLNPKSSKLQEMTPAQPGAGGRKTRRKRKYKNKTKRKFKRKRKKTVRKKRQSKHNKHKLKQKKKKKKSVKKRTIKRHRGGKNEPRHACISYADIFEWHPSDITVGETLLLQPGDGPNAPSHLRPLEVKVHEVHTAGTNDESRRQQRPRVVVIPVIDLEKPPRQQRKMKLYAKYLMPVRHTNVEGREETGEGKYKLCRM